MAIAILAGGRSSRMGRDKASIVVDGETMLERIARRALATGLPVIVVGRRRPDDWQLDDVRFVVDEVPGGGPLGGVVTALREVDGDILVVACDMPLLTTEAIAWLATEWENDPAGGGMVVVNGGRMEPMFSLYAQRSLDDLERRLASDHRSMRAAIDAGDFRRVDAPEWLAPMLANINTSEELELLQSRVR